MAKTYKIYVPATHTYTNSKAEALRIRERFQNAGYTKVMLKGRHYAR